VHIPASEELRHCVHLTKHPFLGSKAFPEVLPFVVGQNSSYVLVQRPQWLVIVTARNNRTQSRDIADVGADSKGKRKASQWHGQSTFLKAFRS
jgi:hypothetical protein